MSNIKKIEGLEKTFEILKKYKKVLENNKFPLEKLILYGSYAKGTYNTNSDIDVCVISKKFIRNKDKHEIFLWKKVLDVDPRIEPVGYHPKEFDSIDPLVNEIQKYGIDIY